MAQTFGFAGRTDRSFFPFLISLSRALRSPTSILTGVSALAGAGFVGNRGLPAGTGGGERLFEVMDGFAAGTGGLGSTGG